MVDRREFLKGTAWMGIAAAAGGCASGGFGFCGATGAPMAGFRVAPIRRIRVGVVGLGSRGSSAVHRLAMIPGVEVAALCDFIQERIDAQTKWFRTEKRPVPREFTGKDGFARMCAWDGIDVVYNVTHWAAHAPLSVQAMEAGKHVFIEVPAAMTVDECWELVETSERTKRHCMQLENCCYGEYEMLGLNLCRKGLLGELVHGECAYIHDLRTNLYHSTRPNNWRLRWNIEHVGNQYPTHGLGPIAQYMNINAGDRFARLVSLESNQANFEAYAKADLPDDDWRKTAHVAMADMNTTLIKTARGRSIMVQHDVSSPRPYTRINMITGTKGIFWGMPSRPEPFRVAIEEKPGAGVHAYLDAAKTEEFRQLHMHPYWKVAGEIAKKVGGHGGMDFLMDLRWAFCLQNGLPLDMTVYDLASWCAVAELSERSVRGGNVPQEFPDFTRGAWKTLPPLGIESVDIDKMGLESDSVRKDEAALNV